MNEQRSTEELSRYVDDIKTIKSLLFDVERRPLYEHWVFYVWGALVIVGTVAQFILSKSYELAIGELFLAIWLPVMVLMALSEIIALVRNLSRYSVSLFSLPYIRFYLASMPCVAALVFIGVLFIKSGSQEYLPLVILLSGSILFAILAQHGGYSSAFVYSFLMFFLTLVLAFAGLPVRILSLVVGVTIGSAVVAVGLTARYLEKKNR